MERTDDPKLSELLKEWQVPGAPPSLDARMLARREGWWSSLLTGSIRVPVPVVVAIATILLVMGVALVRQPAVKRADLSVSLVDFRPADDPQVRVIRGQL